jgi:inorganic pyrophosphatase
MDKAAGTLVLTCPESRWSNVRASSEIQHFFEHYKDFDPGKWVKLIGWGEIEEAKQLISDAIPQRERDVPR